MSARLIAQLIAGSVTVSGKKLTAALVLASIAGVAQAQSLQELYERAKTEKALNLMGAGPAQNYEGLARAFEHEAT